MDPTRAFKRGLSFENPLKVKCGTPAMMQLTDGLKYVGALCPTLPWTLLSVQLIVSPVVTPVTGNFAVPDVSVEECEMCGPTLTITKWLPLGPSVNRIPELFAVMLTLCTIVNDVLCTARHL